MTTITTIRTMATAIDQERQTMKRITVAGAVILASLLTLSGCGDAADTRSAPETAPPADARPSSSTISQHTAAEGPLVVVHLSPTCGCCADWVEHIESAGFATRVHLEANPAAVRRMLGVPEVLGSCHTALVDGYLIEGHVPADDIKRLLEERPDARGLAVPAMPIGSPGMEMGDRRDAYDVLLFDAERARVFTHYPGS
jgi:hypothetical protein